MSGCSHFYQKNKETEETGWFVIALYVGLFSFLQINTSMTVSANGR